MPTQPTLDDQPTTPADPEPTEDPSVVLAPPGVAMPVEDSAPEADETGDDGDKVQFVSTGWVRFVIAGHGRVRLRPARFGQLRQVMEAQEEMLDAIQEVADQIGVQGAALQAKAEADQNDAALSAEDRERLRRGYFRESRESGRKLTKIANEKRAEVWRLIHGMLGVPGERWPADDDLPVWMLDASLMNQVIAHWQSVPLAPGGVPAT